MSKRPTITTVALGLAAAFALYRFVIRPWHLRWGATDEEARRSMPGDDLVPNPDIAFTRAVTINVPAAGVWPCLVAMDPKVTSLSQVPPPYDLGPKMNIYACPAQ